MTALLTVIPVCSWLLGAMALYLACIDADNRPQQTFRACLWTAPLLLLIAILVSIACLFLLPREARG